MVADIENVPEQDTGQRDAERPAPPPPQREAGQRPAADVDDQLRVGNGSAAVAQLRAQDERPERDRDEEPDGVDDPVASRPRTDRVRLGRIDRCQQRRRHQLLGPEPARPGHDRA